MKYDIPQIIYHKFCCLVCGAERKANLPDWFPTLFCAECKRKTDHARID
jgi:hypothetical protein